MQREKTIAVLGLARAGIPAAKFLASRGAKVIGYDNKRARNWAKLRANSNRWASSCDLANTISLDSKIADRLSFLRD